VFNGIDGDGSMEELFYYYGIDNVNKDRHCKVYAYDHDEALSKIASELKTCNVSLWKRDKVKMIQ